MTETFDETGDAPGGREVGGPSRRFSDGGRRGEFCNWGLGLGLGET